MNKETACEILGVSINSSSEKIKKAYRRLSLMHHPDRNNNSIESNNFCLLYTTDADDDTP